MARIADPLREFTKSTELVPGMSIRSYRDRLLAVADEIDAEHERRMRKQSYDLRKAFCRYLGGIINDYRHGIKRKRLRK
jgi:hypothetical protein